MLQVYQLDSARALSANGQVWEIQVLSDKPQGLWANMPFSGRQFYTFGLWSPEHGLKQVPINPLFNIPDMIASAEELIAGLRGAQDKLPFPLTDVQACRYLVKDFGTSESPKSTRQRDSHYAPTVLRPSRFRIAHCSRAACALLHHDSRK
ncbi:MAG: hypothetical protein KZQ65_11320 [Candidatus Thiodiazotropha sp. (ex Gloverina cf. vestifex)]|nr:hypothetical protein [Candidatus Thiodiazotropha sp. (ex Gloverina cf. vestifex)]